MPTQIDSVTKIESQGAQVLRPKPDVKYIGSKGYGFANDALMLAIGNAWANPDQVRKFGSFEVEIEVPPEFRNFKRSLNKSIRWMDSKSSSCTLHVSPVSPANLSVVVPVYNPDLSELDACLTSILKALIFSNATDFEVIVIDDASTIHAADISLLVSRLRKAFNLSENQIHLKVNSNNGGVCFSRNRGFLETRKDFVYFVDADDLVHPWYFPLLHAELNAGADFVSSSMIRTSGEIVCASDAPMSERLVRNTNGSGIGIRRTFFDKIQNRAGPFNAENSFHYEDWELNIFAKIAGANISIIDAALYYYRNDNSGRNASNERFLTYSTLVTPLNAFKSAEKANLDFAGSDVVAYSEILMNELVAMRTFQAPTRAPSRKALLMRTFLSVDQLISNKMYLSSLARYFRRLWSGPK